MEIEAACVAADAAAAADAGAADAGAVVLAVVTVDTAAKQRVHSIEQVQRAGIFCAPIWHSCFGGTIIARSHPACGIGHHTHALMHATLDALQRFTAAAAVGCPRFTSAAAVQCPFLHRSTLPRASGEWARKKRL